MTTKNKLEAAFGKIEKSGWLELAEKWKQELPWKNNAKQIALLVLDYLEKNNKSQKAFAQMMGVSPQLANKWLKGKENFTLQTISKMETILGISLIEVSNKVKSSTMVMAELKPIRVHYQKPENPVEEHSQKTTKIIKLKKDYPQYSIAN